MASGPRFGVMATLDDFSSIKNLDVDFIELLVRQEDAPQEIADFLKSKEMEIIVHAPERLLFEGATRLLDLASPNSNIRVASVQRIQSILDVADPSGVPIVVHPGGVAAEKVDPGGLLPLLVSSLKSMNGRVWLENMPRRYHWGEELLFCNLMLHPHEFLDVLDFIDGITLDVSHAFLSVQSGGNSAIASFFGTLKNGIRHIHLSDAAYPNKEGLMLGDGEIDLNSLPKMRGLPVLLEIWGGHLSDAHGFREALAKVRSAKNPWFQGCAP